MAGEFQCKIGFHRCIDFRRATEIDVPPAVFQLVSQDVFRELWDSFVIEAAQDMKIEDVIRFERCVRFELSQPIAILVLKRHQIRDGLIDCGVERALARPVA
jgi:hypothetical protein